MLKKALNLPKTIPEADELKIAILIVIKLLNKILKH